MSGRLPAGLAAAALIRRVNDAGGMAVLRARGDAGAGAMVIVTLDRDGGIHLWERRIDPQGRAELINATPPDATADAIESYWRRRRRHDPDLWVIELDIPFAERFAAETILDR